MAERTCTIGVAFGGQPGDGRIRTLHTCGAEIVEGPCRVIVQTAPITYEACGEPQIHTEHDPDDGHDYDGYVCTNGHPQEAPSD